MSSFSYSEIKKQISEGKLTCETLVNSYLQNIKSLTHLNAFIEIFENEALENAKKIDLKIINGTSGRLAGMVIGIKDVLCYINHNVSASSKILENFKSVYTASAIQNLIQEDAIIIGRLNCDEFAMGASNENSTYGPVLNYADNTKVSGGSSGGCAVAVQANLCTATIGSDTGGSIRQPAAFTGCVGLKPTYGRISRYGLLAYASSFDQIGPITKNVEDAALLLEIMSGDDGKDATVSDKPKESYSQFNPIASKLKLTYYSNFLESEGMDETVKKQFFKYIDFLKSEGHEVTPITFDYLDYLVPCYYVLTTAEASSNLSRYSGLMYGYRSKNAVDLESTFKKSRSEGFGTEVKRRIMAGTFVLSSDYYDAYYQKAQQVRQIIKSVTEKTLEQYDAVIIPTTPTPAFDIGGKIQDPIAMYLADIFTVQANLAGVSAISIPMIFDQNNLPMGIQIMTAAFNDKKMLEIAKYIESNFKVISN